MFEHLVSARKSLRERRLAEGLESQVAEGRMTEEHLARCASLAAQTMQRTGIDIPQLRALNRYYFTQPSEDLLRRHQQLPDPFCCEFGGATLQIDRDVFCPTLTKASRLLLDAIEPDLHDDDRVLDVFSGSGAFGIIAAMHGASRVITVDTSEKAWTCTRRNAWLNGVEQRVDARLGTVRQCLQPDERIDLVIAQPPLLAGWPETPLEAAIYDDGLMATQQLVADLPDLLAADGRAYIVTSNVLFRQGYDINQGVWDSGLWWPTVVGELNRGTEHYTVHKITQWPDA